MRKLIAIGFWNDGSDGCALRNPQELVDSFWDPPVREAMVYYLRSGRICAQYLGASWCRFDCGLEAGDLGVADLTDGVWMWPQGLAHYVGVHGVRLPEEFVEHARARGFRVRCDGLDQPAEGDLGFWSSWCAEHSNGDPEAVGLWRRTPEEIEASREKILDALVEQHGGFGESVCSWIGCSNPVLNRLSFCPECAHTRMNLWPQGLSLGGR